MTAIPRPPASQRASQDGSVLRGYRFVLLIPIALLLAYSVLYVGHLIPMTLSQRVPPDWGQYVYSGQLVSSGESPYVFDLGWYRMRGSPVLAWLFVPIGMAGPLAWTLLQVTALLTLPPMLFAIALVSWPLWSDIQAGGLMVFAAVSGYHALRGSTAGLVPLSAIALLMPRPLYLPLLALVLWRHSRWRIPFAVATLASLIAAVLTGLHVEWAEALLLTIDETGNRWGMQSVPGWPVIGIVLAGVLTWRGLPGAAGLAVAPYWLPYYFLLPLIADLGHRLSSQRSCWAYIGAASRELGQVAGRLTGRLPRPTW